MRRPNPSAPSKKVDTHASALSGKTKAMPARYSNSKVAVNHIAKHLQDVQIGRLKQNIEGLGVRRVRDPVVTGSNEVL